MTKIEWKESGMTWHNMSGYNFRGGLNPVALYPRSRSQLGASGKNEIPIWESRGRRIKPTHTARLHPSSLPPYLSLSTQRETKAKTKSQPHWYA